MHNNIEELDEDGEIIVFQTSIDVLPSKNQALCEYCTHVSKPRHC